ncbi:MAG: hypothetical protein AAF821_19810 [Cyanobacteria bacterium P01_D01_bin.156]
MVRVVSSQSKSPTMQARGNLRRSYESPKPAEFEKTGDSLQETPLCDDLIIELNTTYRFL